VILTQLYVFLQDSDAQKEGHGNAPGNAPGNAKVMTSGFPNPPPKMNFSSIKDKLTFI